MSARYGLGRLSNSNEFGRLQRKLDNLYNDYNYNTNTRNFLKCSELINDNSEVQAKLCNSLSDIATEEATSYRYCAPSTRPSRSRWPNYSDYYSNCHYTSSTRPSAMTSTSFTTTTTTSSSTGGGANGDGGAGLVNCSCGCGGVRDCAGLSSVSVVTNTNTTTSGAAAEAAAAAAARAAQESERIVYDTLRKKNAEIADLSYKYSKDLSQLESKLTNAKLDYADLKAKLEDTKDELFNERIRSDSKARAAQDDIDNLNYKLRLAENKLATLEPRAELASQLELEIASMKADISRIRAENALLADTNELQAKIIKSRSNSPAFGLSTYRDSTPSPSRPPPLPPAPREVTFRTEVTHRSRSQSPCGDDEEEISHTTIIDHRSPSPRPRAASCNGGSSTLIDVQTAGNSGGLGSNYTCRSVTTTTTTTVDRTSPLSPNHCTQVIRQESLISRFNDLYTRDRMNAMDLLRHYSNFEMNQRIIFAAVQEAFVVAKRTFADWKIRIRSTLSLTNRGPDTLEEAVQNYINKNVDLYDLPYMSAEVISALNRNPKLSLPIGVSFTVISSFIREACRIAWEMSTLAYPLETAFAIDGEIFDDTTYRRSFDSDFSAFLVNHHIWPCLMQGCRVIAKGEVHTRRNDYNKWCSTTIRTSRCTSPLRSCLRYRSPSPCRSTTTTTTTSNSMSRSHSTYCVYY